MSDKAIRLQQVADQRLLHDFAAGGALQVIGAELIVIDLDILIVDAGAVQAGNRLAFQFIQAVERYLHLPCAQALRSRVSVSATSRQLAKRVWLKLLR